jgi:quinoprotein glucose dehydrogenase
MSDKDFVFPNEFYPMKGVPYGVHRQLLSSQFGAPCNPPPWGSVTAVDLVSGEVRWKHGLGTLRNVAPFPVWLLFRGDYGSPSFGGGLSTDTGLYFVGASMDKAFRALDLETGEELWKDQLPFAGNAVPMTYRLKKDGRQFVVIAAGANPISEMGDVLVAYALPEKGKKSD